MAVKARLLTFISLREDSIKETNMIYKLKRQSTKTDRFGTVSKRYTGKLQHVNGTNHTLNSDMALVSTQVKSL